MIRHKYSEHSRDNHSSSTEGQRRRTESSPESALPLASAPKDELGTEGEESRASVW